MGKIVANRVMPTVLKFEDIFAFILGFATKMPSLSQEIHPLDVQNIAALAAKLKHHAPHRLRDTAAKDFIEIEKKLSIFLDTAKDALNCECFDYMRECFYKFQQREYSESKYEFFCREVSIKDFHRITENDRRRQTAGGIYGKNYKPPTHIKKALESLSLLIEKHSVDYKESDFHKLGIELALCNDPGFNYECNYPESLRAYYRNFLKLIPVNPIELENLYNGIKDINIMGWKAYVDRARKEAEPEGRDFYAGFEMIPILGVTWRIFIKSIDVIEDAIKTHLVAGCGTHTDDMADINELIGIAGKIKRVPVSRTTASDPVMQKFAPTKRSKPHYAVPIKKAAEILKINQHTVSAWNRGARKAPPGFPGLHVEADFLIWAMQFKNTRAGKREIREMDKARNYSNDYIDDHIEQDWNADYTPKIDE